MIAMSFNEELDILEIVYNGDIDFDDLINLGEKIRDNSHLPRSLKMLTDASKANYIFPPDKIPQMAEIIKSHIGSYSRVKAAFVQVRPTETAMSIVMNNENNSDKYVRRVFCLRETAIQWLLDD